MWEIACLGCGEIYRDLVAMAKKDGSISFNCKNCQNKIIEFYGDEHPLTKVMIQQLKEEI